MVTFYEKEGFKLFHCGADKKPRIDSYRSTQYHLSGEDTDRIISTGGFIGAWLPENYVVVDIDRNHREGQDGLDPFIKLCKELKVSTNLLKETMVVETGSGGYHLYFTLPEGVNYRDLGQKCLIKKMVDTRNHLGYVIAAGTPGYTLINDVPPIELPLPIIELMRRKSVEKAKPYNPEKELPVKVLNKILKKMDVHHFGNNDDWLEMVTACIATCGNSAQVLDVLEEWSRSDNTYAADESIRTRLETLEPEGGITAGTFLHILKNEEVSKYVIDKVRGVVGAEFNYSESLIEYYPVPFNVDYSLIHENIELIRGFYYAKQQMSGLTLFTKLVEGSLFYVESESRFYYYNGNLWVEAMGVQSIIFSVLLRAGQRFYVDVSMKKDADCDDYMTTYHAYLCSLTTQQRLENALKQYPVAVRKSVPWDSPKLEGTLTLKDTVMDFSGEGVIFRKGIREEYRRLFIDLKEKDFENKSMPENFRQFLKDVFPNDETRKTATYILSTMLSGTGKFRKFHIWNGSGNNGKSSLMEIMTDVIGEDRTATYSPGVLLSSDNTSNNTLTPELAALRGALVAFSSETNEAKRVSEGAIKNLTGDESISANPKYQNQITFKTTFQIVLSTNYLPKFSAHDNAFVNRLLILPFHTCFYDTEEKKEGGKRHGSRYFSPAKDNIKSDIREERAQILYYLAKRYQELDFTIPESPECLEAKEHYVRDNNDVLDMVNDSIEFDMQKNWFTPTKDLVDYYNEDQQVHCASSTVISRVKLVFPLIEQHSKKVNGKTARGWKYIRLKYGAYPEGYMGNFTAEEIDKFMMDEEEF